MACFNLKIFVITLCLFYTLVGNASVLERSFNVSTYIDKSKLYDYSLSLSANPEVFELKFDEDKKKFEQKTIEIRALTDIPASSIGIGFNYNLKLVRNESSCSNTISGIVTKEDFILLDVDGVAFNEDDLVKQLPIDNINEDDTLFGMVPLNVNSKRIFSKVQRCTGVIALSAELAL